jgi:hypothetical protein
MITNKAMLFKIKGILLGSSKQIIIIKSRSAIAPNIKNQLTSYVLMLLKIISVKELLALTVAYWAA